MKLLLLILLLTTTFVFSEPLTLGTVTPRTSTNCPSGWNCSGATITCSSVGSINVSLASKNELAEYKGVIIFNSGGYGTGWVVSGYPEMSATFDQIRQAGWKVILIKWMTPWMQAPTGIQAGLAATGCRPATLVNYLKPTTGLYRIAGSSGGSSAIAYALSHYGLDTIVDRALFISGTVFAAVHKSCMREESQRGYWFNGNSLATVDLAYGYPTGNGVCTLHDFNYILDFMNDSHALGNDLNYPDTDVKFLLGSEDKLIRNIALDYYYQITAHSLTWQILDGLPHEIMSYQIGRDAIRDSLILEQ